MFPGAAATLTAKCAAAADDVVPRECCRSYSMWLRGGTASTAAAAAAEGARGWVRDGDHPACLWQLAAAWGMCCNPDKASLLDAAAFVAQCSAGAAGGVSLESCSCCSRWSRQLSTAPCRSELRWKDQLSWLQLLRGGWTKIRKNAAAGPDACPSAAVTAPCHGGRGICSAASSNQTACNIPMQISMAAT